MKTMEKAAVPKAKQIQAEAAAILQSEESRARLKEDALHLVKVKKPQNILWVLFRHALLIGLCFVILYPVIYMVSNALKPVEQYYDAAVVWIPKSVTLDNFAVVLKVMDLPTIMRNTLLTAILPSLIQTAICMFVAYGLARFDFKGRNIVFMLVILTIIVPQQTISTSLYQEYRYFNLGGLFSFAGMDINLIGTPWVTILPALLGVGLRSGLYIFIYRQFFLSLPKELEEAASIDGCNPYSTFMRVVLPTTKNIVLTVLLLSLVWNWNDFLTPATFMGGKLTISTALARFQSDLNNAHNLGIDVTVANTQIQAACLISIIPLAILYVLTQKYFTESIESSGLTGM